MIVLLVSLTSKLLWIFGGFSMLNNFDRCLEYHHDYETEYLKILYYDLPKGYSGTYRSYAYNRVCTIIDGEKNVTINAGQNFDYSTSEFILLPPHSSVKMHIKENTQAVVFELSDKLIETTKKHIQDKYNCDLFDENPDRIHAHTIRSIEDPLTRIKKLFSTNNPDKGFLIDLTSQELAYHLIKNQCLQDNSFDIKNDPIEFTIRTLKETIYTTISIQSIAYELNMSASNLSSRFKQETGFSPKEFQHLIKLKAAKEDLKEKNVTDVCYALGYENISYFINLFKKFYGETPKQYSMRMQKGRY
jgi:AraC-like DNA-binding protein